MTSSEKSLLARQKALTLHSKHDSKVLTKPARDRFLARFVDEVDPDRKLPETERLRRADYAKRAYFTGLAIKSAKARKAKG